MGKSSGRRVLLQVEKIKFTYSVCCSAATLYLTLFGRQSTATSNKQEAFNNGHLAMEIYDELSKGVVPAGLFYFQAFR